MDPRGTTAPPDTFGAWLRRMLQASVAQWALDDDALRIVKNGMGGIILFLGTLTVATVVIGGTAGQFTPVAFAATLVTAANYILFRFTTHPRVVTISAIVFGGVMATIITYIMYATGPATSIIAVLYGVLTYSLAITVTPRVAFIVTLASLTEYSALMAWTMWGGGDYAPAIPATVFNPADDPSTVLGAYTLLTISLLWVHAIASHMAVQIHEHKGQLQHLDHLKSQYLSVVSHDLRTPMTSFKAYGEMLEDASLSPDERKKFSRVIVSEADRLTRLVTDLLDLDKIEAGKMEWDIQPRDLPGMLTATLNLFKQVAEAHHLTIEKVVRDDCPPVPFDEDRLSQVVTNLLSNAVKFTPEGGTIRLSLAADDGVVRVSIEDTGPGIPDDKLPTLFDRFAQVSAADQKTGSGLGLAIAKEIIEHHGGRIWAENKMTTGAVFAFTLPLA